MSLPHKERHQWVKEISEINRKINATVAPSSGASVAPPRDTGARRTVSGGLSLSNE